MNEHHDKPGGHYCICRIIKAEDKRFDFWMPLIDPDDVAENEIEYFGNPNQAWARLDAYRNFYRAFPKDDIQICGSNFTYHKIKKQS